MYDDGHHYILAKSSKKISEHILIFDKAGGLGVPYDGYMQIEGLG